MVKAVNYDERNRVFDTEIHDVGKLVWVEGI